MFRAKTVIILGAGASWHYGYPTGEELVKLVIGKARTARKYFTDYPSNSAALLVNRPRIVSGDDPAVPKDGDTGLRKQWATAANKCEDLIERLNAADPLVIDYFIDANRHLEDIAKLCIAWVISGARIRVHSLWWKRKSPWNCTKRSGARSPIRRKR